MTDPVLTAPVHLRAGANPRPSDWADHPLHLAASLQGSTPADWEVFTDTSEFQPYYDDSYQRNIAAFRLDNGWRLDYKAAGNFQYLSGRLQAKTLRAIVCYVVFIPGQAEAIFERVQQFFKGFGGLPDRVVFEPDMESGAGFAGPGDHSKEANLLAKLLAEYSGHPSLSNVLGYGNRSDLNALWSTIDSRIKTNVASYGSEDPGGYAQQYYGGLAYPSPTGLPRSQAPFGGWVDLNVIRRSIDQIEQDFGFFTTTPTTGSDLLDMDENELRTILREEHTRIQLAVLRGTPNGGYSGSDVEAIIGNTSVFGRLSGNQPLAVRFPNFVNPNVKDAGRAIYSWNGAYLTWLTGPDWALVASSYRLVDFPNHQNSNVFKCPITPGTPDPRKV